jgi:hypothetical protein
MAYLQIPTRTDKDNYTFKLSLENVLYEFKFVWSYRSSCWEMTITDVVSSLAVRVGTSLLEFVPAEGKPPGKFAAVDTSGAGIDPGLADLGARVLLIYKESTT